MLASIFESHNRDVLLDYTRTGNAERNIFADEQVNLMFDEFVRGYEFHREMFKSEELKCH